MVDVSALNYTAVEIRINLIDEYEDIIGFKVALFDDEGVTVKDLLIPADNLIFSVGGLSKYPLRRHLTFVNCICMHVIYSHLIGAMCCYQLHYCTSEPPPPPAFICGYFMAIPTPTSPFPPKKKLCPPHHFHCRRGCPQRISSFESDNTPTQDSRLRQDFDLVGAVDLYHV